MEHLKTHELSRSCVLLKNMLPFPLESIDTISESRDQDETGDASYLAPIAKQTLIPLDILTGTFIPSCLPSDLIQYCGRQNESTIKNSLTYLFSRTMSGFQA